MSFRHILVPINFSDRSDTAFHLAQSLARDVKARLTVLHLDPPPAGEGSTWGIEREHYLREQLQRRYPAEPGVAVDYELELGEPGEGIVKAARDRGCDLIVMATYGRTGLNRLLMGSLAEEVVRKAPCPVMTLNRMVAVSEHAAPGATQAAG